MNTTTLGHLFAGRDNNFNLMRFTAAFLVLFSHSYPLFLGVGTQDPLKSLTGITFGALAVDIFFVTSGFLIAGSYFSRQNIIAFTVARILRIFPALWVALLVSVFAIGMLTDAPQLLSFLSDIETLEYLFFNATLILGLQWDLPGVFGGNPYPVAVNGSLWTLPWEIAMYGLVVLVAIIAASASRKIHFLRASILIPILAVAGLLGSLLNVYFGFYAGKGLHLFAMFFIGSSLYLLRSRIVLSTKVAWICCAVVVVGVYDNNIFQAIYLFVTPYLVMFLAYKPAGKVRSFNKFGDYSYGLYVYAFPVQQTVIWAFPDLGFVSLIALSLLITMLFAILSWHFVEKPVLRFKDKYVHIEMLWNKTLGRTESSKLARGIN